MARKLEAPVLLVRWYDHTKWILERVDSFPKNQRFVFGTRLADTALDIMELLIEASYTRHKASLLHRANIRLEKLRWLTRLAKDRKVITPRQFEYSAEQLTECGKMLGGWLRSVRESVHEPHERHEHHDERFTV
jgi:hypothetical protein